MASAYKYAGFISYAHADEAVAARLQRALETFKTPKDLAASSSNRLSPLFRDTTELTAHHSLSEKIHDAVTASRVLIVLCSPAAKLSHWVNEEIRLFRTVHGEAAILCVLVEGTPETSFPPALLDGGREPLAANLGQSRDSFRLGVTQLAASMLGVGLDTLIQRDTRRRRRRLQGVTAAAVAFSAFMATTTFTAVNARKAAETNRMQAEGLVEYMITDLKEKLEPVGRLDILDSVGARAVQYYDAQDIDGLPDDSLARQARARHILGQVALDAGDIDKARSQIEAAARITKEVYDRNPEDTDAIFAHAQSEFWLGNIYIGRGKFEEAMRHWQIYADLSENLNVRNPKNIDWMMERGWGANNLGMLHNRLNDLEKAEVNYLEAIEYFSAISDLTDDDFQAQKELGNVLEGLAQISTARGDLDQTRSRRQRQINLYEDLLARQPGNFTIKFEHAQALSRLITDGVLDDDTERLIQIIEIASDEYEILIQHDGSNEFWRQEYYLALKAFLKKLDDLNLKLTSQDKYVDRLLRIRPQRDDQQ